MPEITPQTPVREATVLGFRVQMHAPYVEGYALNANEAAVMNQTRCENVRNNCAADVQKLIEEATAAGSEADPVAVQTLITDYSLIYQFGERVGGYRTSDPVEQAMMEIARELIKDKIRMEPGVKISEVPAAKITELARQACEHEVYGPKIRTRAEKIVKARKDAAKEISLDLTL